MSIEELRSRQIRMMAFNWLFKQIELCGDVLPRKMLSDGFRFDGERVTLVGPPGIWKPRLISEIPLTITTALDGPYDDSFSKDELLIYRYRGSDPKHRDNVGLRKAMQGRSVYE